MNYKTFLAYILFEFFAFTLETALKQNLITEDNRTDIIKQCMNIITILQTENKKTCDIRPGVFGINDKITIKLLDFGNEITEKKMFNNDKIVKERMKYQPPEYFVFNGEDLNYDLWSFGCLLIDMYSTELPIYDMDISQDELCKNICNGNFPKIPNDISPLLQNILLRCFEKDYIKRVPSEKFYHNKMIETLALSNTNPMLKTYIICSGFIYGCGEDLFYDYFKMSWLETPRKLPIIGKGKNTIPTIHIIDLVSLIKRVIENKPKNKYIFAIDHTKNRKCI